MRLLFLPLLLLAGCSAGFHREEMYASLGGQVPQVTDQAIRDVLTRKAQLPKPFRVTLYFRPVDGENWKPEDKQLFLDLALPKEHVRSLSPLLLEPGARTDLPSLRLKAARQGADALLYLSGAKDQSVGTKTAALSYLLVLPMLFVRGNDYRSLFIARAWLYDVKNEYLYLGAEAEVEKEASRPLVFPGADELEREARQAALARLREELLKQLHSAWN